MNENYTGINNNDVYSISLIMFLNQTITRYGLGLIWLMGNIGSIFTCIIFSRPMFRNSSCAMYFIASSFSQFFAFNFALLIRILQYGYRIELTNMFVWFCKMRYYLFYILVAISRYNIIFASIDCYFASCRDALRRQWSSRKIALRVILGNVLFWSIIYIQVLIFYTNKSGQCTYQSGTYERFFSIYISIDSGILPVLLMLLFGLLTIRNINLAKGRTRPMITLHQHQLNKVGRISKEDSQLYQMLVNQICIYIILNLANPCYLVYASFTIDIVKSSLRLTIEAFVSNMTYVLVYLGFSLTFFTFILSSKMFRKEFQRFIREKLRWTNNHGIITLH